MTDYKLVPAEPTQDMLSRAMSIVTGFSGAYGEYNDYLDEETAREVYAAFLATAPTIQVAALVEALQAVLEFGDDTNTNRGAWAVDKANKALATYHKHQEPDHDKQ